MVTASITAFCGRRLVHHYCGLWLLMAYALACHAMPENPLLRGGAVAVASEVLFVIFMAALAAQASTTGTDTESDQVPESATARTTELAADDAVKMWSVSEER